MFHDDSIAGSWQALVRRIETTDALGRWAVEDDRLAGLHDVARDLLPLLAGGADAARADDILGALVSRAAIDGGGDDDALLLTLHLLSDWVWPLAVQLRDLGTGMVGVIVSELTCQIRTYPWRVRTRAVAASLRWDIRCAVLAEFRPSTPQHRHRAEQVLEPMSPEWEATPLGRVATAAVDDEDIDLVDLLLWAARAGVDEADIALLVRTEQARADSSLKASDDVVAAEFSLPRRTFFRHRARALDAVRAASRDYLAAVA
jgi:hypothetical protein